MGRFINAGGVVKGDTSSNTFFANFTNSGSVTINAGTVDFSGGYVQTGGVTLLNGGALKASSPLQTQGGKLTGSGTVTANVTNSGGVVDPGNP